MLANHIILNSDNEENIIDIENDNSNNLNKLAVPDKLSLSKSKILNYKK